MFCNLIGLEQWYFSLIWNTYKWKLQTLCGKQYEQIIAFTLVCSVSKPLSEHEAEVDLVLIQTSFLL